MQTGETKKVSPVFVLQTITLLLSKKVLNYFLIQFIIKEQGEQSCSTRKATLDSVATLFKELSKKVLN